MSRLFLPQVHRMIVGAIERGVGESVPYPARLGAPAEFALLAEQVQGRMHNGETIRLDAGLRMQPR